MPWSKPIQLGSLVLGGLIILLVAAALAVACGGGAKENEEEEIRSLVDRFFQALTEEDFAGAYDSMSDGYQRQCLFPWFERELKSALTQAGPLRSWAVTEVSLDKDHGQGTVTWEFSDGTRERTWFFLKKEAAWVIAPELDPQRGDEEICGW